MPVSPKPPFRARPAAAATVTGGLLNIYLACYQVPRFARIFHDRLSRQSLPALTHLLVDGRWLFMALACLWPVLVICAIRSRRAQFYIVTLSILITVQVACTVIALYLPLLTVLHHLPD